MVYDTGILNRLGSKEKVIEYWKNAEPHLQARYCHGLGTKIKIERVAHPYYGEFAPILDHYHASYDMLVKLQQATKFILGDADLVVYMTDNVDPTNSGYSDLSSVCTDYSEYNAIHNTNYDADLTKKTINQWTENPSRFGAVSTIGTFFLINVVVNRTVYR